MNHAVRTAIGVRLAMATALVCALAGPANAHARYVGSDPADNETVDTPPSEVTAEYSEPLEPDSHMEVYNPCGQRVDGGDVRVTGYEMSVSMSADSAGTYVVAWTAASAIDPHVTKGNFTFNVRQGNDCNAAPEETKTDEGADEGPRESTSPNDDGRSDVAAPEGKDRSSSEVGPSEKRRQRKHARHRNMRRSPRSSERKTLAQAQDPDSPEPSDESEELPLSSVLVALAMSIVIGASGGWVYAGLLGPRS